MLKICKFSNFSYVIFLSLFDVIYVRNFSVTNNYNSIFSLTKVGWSWMKGRKYQGLRTWSSARLHRVIIIIDWRTIVYNAVTIVMDDCLHKVATIMTRKEYKSYRHLANEMSCTSFILRSKTGR